MQILLSSQAPDNVWGKNTFLTFQQNQAIIHFSENFDRTLIQKAARKLRGQGIKQAELVGEHWNADSCWAFYQGFYTAKQDFEVDFPELDETENEKLLELIESGDFVREIINLPSDVLTPEVLVNRAVQFIQQQAEDWQEGELNYQIIKGQDLQAKGYHGIWTVGKGSANAPVMLQLDFNPTGDKNAPVLACLVGKGITFDTGGYSLKPSNSMDSMKADMGGAALLTGALGLAIAQGLNARVKLYLCCAENMISSHAFKLNDIITYKNGVTVEVLNTDAEGRLVLADGLIEADAQNPQFIIDAATLTGAAKRAVGNDYHSVLSMDEQLVADLLQQAEQTQELFWRLPFASFHRPLVTSAFADIGNSGYPDTSPGASTATAFLSYFVKNYQQHWLHLDCSATYRKSSNELWATGATGIGVQTLANLLLTRAKQGV
ncbi:aminopeptidase PepB [Lonepinella koalarum]|uniref:Aminopeptidase B n=1 Tax=Lonepinella koalarum TaxID=53417 RepID=A0A4R1KT93_9PAST|nr:aminopeptidase PepB [Lonepinella koalarum]MDH2927536.1 aminopeptidase PepB [Lonepinella koalarum]TCK68322.1 aminopeptidase B [Lonepinella koalarum]TFJ89578.1 aminopeptidase PepB [Lonepinella koalarum]TYG35400.1 aminopeptidase PepB [Lonepinella koalarum]